MVHDIGFGNMFDYVQAAAIASERGGLVRVVVTALHPATHADFHQILVNESRPECGIVTGLLESSWFPGVIATSFEHGLVALKEKYLEMSPIEKEHVSRYNRLYRSDLASLREALRSIPQQDISNLRDLCAYCQGGEKMLDAIRGE